MIYKNELKEIAKLLKSNNSKISRKCGWNPKYLDVCIKNSSNPLSILVSSRIFYHFPNTCKKVLPKHRVFVIEEYIANASPSPILKDQSKAAKQRVKLLKSKKHAS